MLTDGDKLTIREIFREEMDRVECMIDKVLTIATRSDKESVITKSKVDLLHKRMGKVERKLGLPVATGSAIFA